MKHLIISSEKIQAHHYIFRKKWSASLFLQKKIKHLIISSEKNQGPHYFLSNKWGTSLFLQKQISIFFWRNNVALDFFTAEITLAGLLRSQAQAPPYFFRKNEVPLPLFLKEQRCVSLFLQKKWGTSLFPQEEIMRRLKFLQHQ